MLNYFYLNANKMGLWNKIKEFGSKVINKIKTGWDKIKPVIRTLYHPVKEVISNVVPGSRHIFDTGEKIYNAIAGGGGH